LSGAPNRVWTGAVMRTLASFALLQLLISCSAHEAEPRGEVRIGGRSASTAQRGSASWYGEDFRGKPTASGEPYDPDAFTAAHPTIAFGTMVRVTSVANRKSVTVRVNDRFGGHRGRIIDLSKAAFAAIAPPAKGVDEVELEILPRP